MHRHKPLLSALLPTCLASIIPLGLVSPSSAATNVAFAKTKVAGVYINLVTIDLNAQNVRITPAIANGGIGASESFRSMMRRTRPAAAINGTFFCTKTLEPTGDIVIDGELLAKGVVGTAIGIGPGNKITFVPSRRDDLYDWHDYDHVLTAGPALVLRGETIVLPGAQGFRSGVHYSRRKRSAIGLTSANKLVFVTTGNKVHLRTLAHVMKTLGCVDAAVLDGGSSTGLYWKGKLIANPTRGMTNCLLAYDNVSEYELHRAAFRPDCPAPGSVSAY